MTNIEDEPELVNDRIKRVIDLAHAYIIAGYDTKHLNTELQQLRAAQDNGQLYI